MFKVDLALDARVPWIAEGAADCGVFHLTGSLDNMARAAFEARRGLLPSSPMLIVGQQSVADPSRAPKGGQTLWVETHVPPEPRGDGGSRRKVNGWATSRDAFLERVLARLEEHAPGLGGRIVGTHVRTPVDLQDSDPNLVGGDGGGGSPPIPQQLTFPPGPRW